MSEVVVVGAGVVGLLSAFELVRRGHRVTVVDQSEPGAGSSAGNAGWIVPSMSGPVPAPGLALTSLRWMVRPGSPLHVRPSAIPGLAPWLWSFLRHCNATAYQRGLLANAGLNRHTFELFDELERAGVVFERHRTGVLVVALDEDGVEHVLDDLEQLSGAGYERPALLRGADLHDLEPALSAEVACGIWIEREEHVRPESLTAGLVRWLTERGAEIATGVEVTGAERTRRHLAAVTTTDRSIFADAFVLAAGAWSGLLARQLGFHLPVQSGKGYSITREAPPVPLRHALYLSEARVACSPFDGAMRLAGTMELAGVDTRLRPRRLQAIQESARRYLKGWESGGRDALWAGMRPLTPDGLPAIGRAPGYDNLFVATGHGMLGVTLGPATAVAIADLITTGSAGTDLTPFDPARFVRSPA